MFRQSTKKRILNIVNCGWKTMWDNHPDGATFNVIEATKAEITRQLMPLLEANAEDLPQIICYLAQNTKPFNDITDSLLTVLETFDSAGQQHLALFKDKHTPYAVRKSTAGYLAHFSTPEVRQALREVLFNPEEEDAVKSAALSALVKQGDKSILPALKDFYADASKFWTREILRARGELGDLSSARDLMELRNDSWFFSQECATQGLQGLEKSIGGAEALAATLFEPQALQEPTALQQVALHDRSATVRRWALDHLVELYPEKAQALLLHALKHGDWREQQSASFALAALPNPPLKWLRGQVADAHLSDQQRGWAALTLKQLGQEVDLSVLRESQVSLPAYITPDLRRAIINEWANQPSLAEAGTDVRWLLEGFEYWSDIDEQIGVFQQKLSTLIAAWQAAGLKVDSINQNGGSFHGEVAGIGVSLSYLGPYAACDESFKESTKPSALDSVQAVLKKEGWRILNWEILSTVIPALCIYEFRGYENVTVHDLLFYSPN